MHLGKFCVFTADSAPLIGYLGAIYRRKYSVNIISFLSFNNLFISFLFFSSQWNSRESNGNRLISLIKRWKICLPEVLLYNILGQLIFPKLQYEVESFNPESDSKLIYDLLNKWSSLFKDHLELLFESIQKKSAERL